MRHDLSKALAGAACCFLTVSVALLGPASGADDSTPAGSTDGKFADKAGNPTFKIDKDGTVDWYTYIGYQQYGANCLQCHGPDALGSSYAPSLVDALKSMDFNTFVATVAGGKKDVNASQDLVMPALGTNKNVMCNIDAIYVYLRARADGALGRGRPDKHVDKPANFDKVEDSCLG
jgi:methanol metabolism-related c-type cytochrome